nr:hypothetical protein CoNPh38_CDS0271 [Staphylococcus phage S-CoN_Ph38]
MPAYWLCKYVLVPTCNSHIVRTLLTYLPCCRKGLH